MKIEDILRNLPSRDDIASVISGQTRNADIDIPTALGVFGAGLLLGAGLALLFAPKPGDQLRHDLAEKLDDVRHKLDNRTAASDSNGTELSAA
jgi:hypothetical protein